MRSEGGNDTLCSFTEFFWGLPWNPGFLIESTFFLSHFPAKRSY